MLAVEIEIDGQHNEELYFRPLQKSIRGRFDLNRIGEPSKGRATTKWTQVVPSMLLGIDEEGIGYLQEPLYDDEYAPTRERIEKAGMKLEPEIQKFEDIDLPSWYFWLRRAVQSGIAKVTKGKFPKTLDGEPTKNYITNEAPATSNDKLVEALDRQSKMFAKLISTLAKTEEKE